MSTKPKKKLTKAQVNAEARAIVRALATRSRLASIDTLLNGDDLKMLSLPLLDQDNLCRRARRLRPYLAKETANAG